MNSSKITTGEQAEREISISALGFAARRLNGLLWKTNFGKITGGDQLFDFVDECWRAGYPVTLDGREIPPPDHSVFLEHISVRDGPAAR